ncbi:MAG: exodeoxyribonuclease VII small subunit [Planctomycetota bacterium]
MKVDNMAKGKQKTDIEKLSFEQAIKELTSIVGKIEQGEIPLQDSLEQYEKGMALIKHCRTILQKAEKRIEKISKEEKSGDRSQESE